MPLPPLSVFFPPKRLHAPAIIRERRASLAGVLQIFLDRPFCPGVYNLSRFIQSCISCRHTDHANGGRGLRGGGRSAEQIKQTDVLLVKQIIRLYVSIKSRSTELVCPLSAKQLAASSSSTTQHDGDGRWTMADGGWRGAVMNDG